MLERNSVGCVYYLQHKGVDIKENVYILLAF